MEDKIIAATPYFLLCVIAIPIAALTAVHLVRNGEPGDVFGLAAATGWIGFALPRLRAAWRAGLNERSTAL